jgi:hypothetical protein
MKKIAILSVFLVACAGIAAARCVLGSDVSAASAPTDDPTPGPSDCPLCGGNAALHVQRMQVIETLQLDFAAAALRW